MRTDLALSGVVAACLLAGGVTAAAPAYASSNTAYVTTGSANQYLQFCETQSTCNEQQQGTLNVQFARTGNTQSALGIFYKIINGTAVDGTDFNTPTTGEAIIAAGQIVAPALVIPLVNEHQYGTSKSFTVQITSTTTPITLSPGSATGTILGGSVPLDCAFTWISTTAQSMTCTARPATQVWRTQNECHANMGPPFIPEPGNNVTGDGTSTITANCTLLGGTFFLVP
ncbi:MAG TPA: Calx-beta domain-containing protein [Streptosporangiaceae bacterium]